MNVVPRPRNGLSLCAGAGGLDLGLMLAEPGFHTRCWVEWELYPRRAIIAGQRAGYFAPAPIWDDVTTFDGKPFRGAIDTILAGYPCQPFSAAGQRKGDKDERHLWPDVARIIREVCPEWVFLENVAGHVSLGLETVLRDLWQMGWTPAAGIFSAGETGAPHERQRVFIVAYRDTHADAGRMDIGRARRETGRSEGDGEERKRLWAGAGCSGNIMADPHGRHPGAEREQRGGEQRFQPEGGGTGAQSLDDTPSPRCDDARLGTGSDQQGGERLSGAGCGDMGNPTSLGCGEGRAEHGIRGGWDAAAVTGRAMADAERSAGHEGRTGRRASGAGSDGQAPDRPFGQGVDPFPPGPGDSAAWASVLAADPTRAPAIARRDVAAAAIRVTALLSPEQAEAIERGARGMAREGIVGAVVQQAQEVVGGAAAFPGFRDLAHGVADRSRALRLLGNGVYPLAAGHAWRTLATAHGLGALDLGAERRE